MSPRKTPVGWLRTFEVAARHLSLSAAAAELNVTPAAVSQQVRLLELRLGKRLFERHPRGLRLTVAGHSLAPACRESFERLDNLVAELFESRPQGQLTVRVLLGFAGERFLHKVLRFAASHPDIPVRLVTTTWAAESLDATVDVDIRLSLRAVPDMESHQLSHDEIFPVCSPAFLKRARRLQEPKDLLQAPLLTSIGFAEGWRHWLAAAGVKQTARDSVEFDSMRLALESAALGHGVALARSSYVADMLRSNRLKRLWPLSIPASDNLFMLLAPGLAPESATAKFRNWMLEKARHPGKRGGPAPSAHGS